MFAAASVSGKKGPVSSLPTPKNLYQTAELRFAAFLKVQGVPLIRIEPDALNKRMDVFVFELAQEKADEYWYHYRNNSRGGLVDARQILQEYEDLRTWRFKNPRKS